MEDQVQAAFAIRILVSLSKPCLIVFDEYDDPAPFSNLDEYIHEHENNFVLITTQYAAVYQQADLDYQIQLPSPHEDEAIDLLMREAQSKAVVRKTGRQTAKGIAAHLGCHALAIAQAGSYIKSNRQALDKSIDKFEQEKANFLENWRHQISRYRKKVGDAVAKLERLDLKRGCSSEENIENTPRSSKDSEEQQEPAIDHNLKADEEQPR